MQLIARRQIDRINKALISNADRNDGFLGGKLGLSFYYYNAYKVFEERFFADNAKELLDEVFENFNSGKPALSGVTFSNGATGLAYVVNFMQREGFITIDMDEEFAELDKYLFDEAVAQIDGDYIDYLHGALGIVFYFSERASSVIIKDYLDILIKKICERVVVEETGCWFKNYSLNSQGKSDINFSLSHGLSGTLLILLKAYQYSKHHELIKKVVTDGVRFILKHKIDVDYSNGSYSFFPFIIKDDTKELVAPSRLAWCYGDLNEVLLLYRAAKILGDNTFLQLADLMGMQTLLRKESTSTLITDSHFCHGSAGLAQFYRTLYKESKKESYLCAYEYWIEQTILLLDHDLAKKNYVGKEWRYLEGLVGVGFTLLSYISKRELNWSKSLLL